MKNSVDEELINTIARVDEQDQLVCVNDLELMPERFCSEDVSIVSPFSCCGAHKMILSKEIINHHISIARDETLVILFALSNRNGTKSYQIISQKKTFTSPL